MSVPVFVRAACSNALRRSIVRHQPSVLGATARFALRSKPISQKRGAWGVFVNARPYSTGDAANNTVDYEYIQRIIKDNKQDIHVIDVREPNELLQGAIPSAKNVPLSKFLAAWSLPDDDFQDEFGFTKPGAGDEVICYCQAGIRSSKAADFLREMGYRRVFNYPGSWADYAERSAKSG